MSPHQIFVFTYIQSPSSKSTLPQSIICYHPEFKMEETTTCFSMVFSLAHVLRPWSSTCAFKSWQTRNVDHCCPRRSANRLLCWLEMALCPLAPQGFKTWKRSHCRLWTQNLTVSSVVMDQDWNQTGFWLSVKENVSEVVPEQWGRSACSTLQVFLRLPRDLALIRTRFPRIRQLSDSVYTWRVTPLLAGLLSTSYFMYAMILWPQNNPKEFSQSCFISLKMWLMSLCTRADARV